MANRVITPRRRKEWAFTPIISNAFTANATFLGGRIAFTGGGHTVLRMLGEYTLAPTSATAALDEAFVTYAIAVISSDAFEVGITGVPDPSEEPEFPWLYWAQHPLFYAGTTSDPSTAGSTVRHSFDVRSQRKIGPRQSLAVIAQYVNSVGNPPITLSIGAVRVLLALP